MTADIVERLRLASINMQDDGDKTDRTVACCALKEAADEIERLREGVAALQASSGYEASIAQVEIERLREELIQSAARVEDLWKKLKAQIDENERLRAALQDIAVGLGEDVLGQDAMRARARHALSEGPPQVNE